MAIGGGIKLFNKSKNIDATASAPISGDASVAALLDSNKETFYRSVGSDDTTVETITITFAEDKTIDRLFILDTNLKDFDIKYDLSGVYTHFANVLDIDASRTNITRTDFAQDTYYAEFDSVTTGGIQITATKSQVVDAEKYINQVIATTEIGTLVGFPDVKQISIDRSLRSSKTLSGKYAIQKSLETFAIKISMKGYPATSVYNVDIDQMLVLHDSEDPFLVWLCGGKFGTTKFKYTIRGFRLKDVIQMQVKSSYKLSYVGNIYVNSVNLASINLVEHI